MSKLREELQECRREIEACDIDLAKILATRSWHVREAQRLKKRMGLPARDRKQEELVVRGVLLTLQEYQCEYMQDRMVRIWKEILDGYEETAEG